MELVSIIVKLLLQPHSDSFSNTSNMSGDGLSLSINSQYAFIANLNYLFFSNDVVR